ncbi:MAG TPA: methyltransferase domain-containing protein [Paludibaculum sp.]|jgi:tRNA (mo5U34)-methyltransferase
MAYRLGRVAGKEVQITLDDQDRASGLWQYVLKPAGHAFAGVSAAVEGAMTALTTVDAPGARHVPGPTANPTPEQKAILERIAGIDWYHTIDLGHDICTPGRFNHIPLLDQYRLPESLAGKRCLDVATMNGFWAFEMERRGAKEVVALDVATLGDLDMPPRQRARLNQEALSEPRGSGFYAAKEILGSRVERVALNVYDLSPEVLGSFDFVMVGDLLLHLMNPLKAAANVCSVTSSSGMAHFVECYSPYLPRMAMTYQSADQGTWWGFSLSALKRILWDAGFDNLEMTFKFRAPTQPGEKPWMWRAVFDCRKDRQ